MNTHCNVCNTAYTDCNPYLMPATCNACMNDSGLGPATLKGYLTRTYGNDVEALEDMAEDGCNWGGDMTRELYFQYYSCIWRADYCNELKSVSIGKFSDHTDFARYMLSHAVRYYCTIIIASRED